VQAAAGRRSDGTIREAPGFQPTRFDTLTVNTPGCVGSDGGSAWNHGFYADEEATMGLWRWLFGDDDDKTSAGPTTYSQPADGTTYSQRFDAAFARNWQDDPVLRASDPFTYRDSSQYYK